MKEKIFCGIEGGASFSKLVLVKGNGDVLCFVNGPACNHLLIGLEECQKRIVDMIEKAKHEAKLDKNTVLDALCLCMSGCEEEAANRVYEKQFLEKYPHVMKVCVVKSDTIGPLYTASPKGGLVLIAGTGSNSLLINPDGTTGRCGGWGHILGDEASGMWIALKAVKTYFDDEDNLVKCPYDTSKVKELMLQHFKVTDKFGILEHCYTNFNKSYFAALCAKLAQAAKENSDPLCCNLFYEAGKVLAAMVVALKPKVHKDFIENNLPVVCVGSVFKSWDLLEKGFVEGLKNQYHKCTLMTLTCSAALGAAYLAAKSVNCELPLDYNKNTSVLYVYESSTVNCVS